MKKIAIFLVLFIIPMHLFAAESRHGVSMFGDLKYPPNFTHFDYVNPDAPKGGFVKLGLTGTFDSLNPNILKGVPADMLDLTADTLMTPSADEPSSSYGLIAQSAEIANDKSYIIYNLRKIAHWNDGSPITADDIVFSFDTIMTKGHPSYRAYYADVEKCEKINTYKVKFTFKTNKNKELPLIIGQLPIISKEYYSKNEFDKTTMTPPLSSGPYKIKEVEPGRSITYERDKNYWGQGLAVNKGRYNFDKIRIDYFRDETVTIEALKAGNYDFRRENISKIWKTSYNIPQVEDGRMIKEELPDGVPTGMQSFVFNTRRANFKNPLVREALSYAFDFEWANKQLFFDAYARNTSFFGNSEFASSGLPSKAELKLLEPFRNQIPEEVFTKAYSPAKTKGDGNARENLIIAKNLLEKAGWYLKDMKLINPETGKPVQIEFLLDSPAFERIVAPFARNLKKLGIDSSIRTVDSSQYIKRREDFDFDVIVHWFRQGPMPGNEQINYWHSSGADVKGSLNLIGIKNPAVDALVTKITEANSMEELKNAARALDRVLLSNYYVIPQWYSRSHRVIYWNKFNRPKIVAPFALGMIDTWWMK